MPKLPVQEEIVDDLEARPDDERRGERHAHQRPRQGGRGGPSDAAREISDAGGARALFFPDDRHDVGLSGRYVHLHERFPNEEERDGNRKVRGKWNGHQQEA